MLRSADIPLIRLESQHIAGNEFTSPQSIIAYLGAMQAQDFPMAKWALGLRLPGSTDQLITSAIDNGDILRTHLLRPTWHFVSPEDIHWLLDLTAPLIKAGERSRDRDLELTEAVYTKSNRTIEKALGTRGQLSREELILELNQVGIATDENRASHLLMRAELDKIICSGAVLRGKPTYALLSERSRKPRRLTKDEALAELARRYFPSRSPATLQDFSWWSGLPAKDARQALELIKSDLVPQQLDGNTYWLTDDHSIHPSAHASLLLLPTYDEFIISYTDRSASIPLVLEQHMKDISNRGIFWPIIVLDGQVIGTWKRTMKKNCILLELQPFTSIDPLTNSLIKQEGERYANFLGKELELVQK